MNFNDRFSLLLLEPGEIYFYDIAVKYQLPHKSQNEKEGWELLYFQEEIQGRLKICSKSLVFDSRIPQIPLIKFPLKHCHIIGKIGKYVNLSDSVDEYNNDDDNSTLELTCDLSIEMLENNVIKPFKFRKVRYTHMFNLNFTKPSEVLPLIQQLQRASTLPPNDHNVMVEAIVRSLQNRITFNYCNIKDIREKNVLELKASKVSPLVTNPGRVLVTDAALYYQPFNNLEKECLLRIPLVEFEQVIKRRFLLRHVGLEIFYKERNISRFLFLIFKDPEDRNDIYDCLMKQESLNLQNVDLPQETYKWQLGLISNYEYLMYLNSQADRSMNDLTQYPVFPWLISDYVSEDLNLSDEAVFRDMTKPVGALNEERLHKLRERFKDMPEPKFLYGSHYSTPGFVLFYLVRQYPLLMLCLQGGKFDHPDRMFNSLPDAWRNVTTSCSDFKELTPEFYDLESAGLFLKNDKAIPLGMRQSGQPVWDVSLPPWAKDPAHLVSTLRKALESDYVSYNLHHWIDLIFGYKQKGSEAVKADNVFYHLCYEGAVDVDSITDLQEKISVEVQIMEFGQIPKQIFTTPHPHKSRCLSLYNSISPLSCCELMKKASLSEVSELASEEENPKHILLYSQLSSLSSLGASRLHLQGIMHVMFIPSGNMLISLGKDGFLKAYSVPTLDKVGNLESGSLTLSCGVHLPGTNEILIGSWDNYLYRFNYKLCQKQDSLQAHSDAITCMDMNSEVLVTGSWDSLVRVWDITNLSYSQLPSGWSFWRLMMDHLICQMDHDQPVNRVAIHPQKDLFASGTTDGFINIWHLKKDIHFLSIHCHNGAVNGLYWSPDGGSVMSSSEDGKLILVETSSGNQISLFTLEEAAKSLLWDGRIAIVGTSLGAIVFVDVARDEILRTIIGHSGAVNSLALSPNRRYFASGGEDRTVMLWGLP